MICKDNFSGIKNIFLLPFVYFPRRFFIDSGIETAIQLKIQPKVLEKSSLSINYNDGFFSQSLRFKTSYLEQNEVLNEIKDKDLRAIVTDWKGNNFLIGQQNGLNLKFNGSSGVNKTDFSGFDFTLEGKEKEEYIKVTNLNQFIENASLFLASSNELSSSSIKVSNIYNG
jgi:hypothetical protein